MTARSITSRTQLLMELESTAARGYAINFGELEEGIGSIAVAVTDASGTAIASIGVGAPASRLTEEHLQHFAASAQTCAGQLGAELMPPATMSPSTMDTASDRSRARSRKTRVPAPTEAQEPSGTN